MVCLSCKGEHRMAAGSAVLGPNNARRTPASNGKQGLRTPARARQPLGPYHCGELLQVRQGLLQQQGIQLFFGAVNTSTMGDSGAAQMRSANCSALRSSSSSSSSMQTRTKNAAAKQGLQRPAAQHSTAQSGNSLRERSAVSCARQSGRQRRSVRVRAVRVGCSWARAAYSFARAPPDTSVSSRRCCSSPSCTEP